MTARPYSVMVVPMRGMTRSTSVRAWLALWMEAFPSAGRRRARSSGSATTASTPSISQASRSRRVE
jgi:hypothetical protein